MLPKMSRRRFADQVIEAISAGKILGIRAVRTRSERLKDAVSSACRQKYHTPGAVRYVRDLNGKKSRNTTTELAPR